MKISEWNEETPRKAGSGSGSEASNCDDSSVWGRRSSGPQNVMVNAPFPPPNSAQHQCSVPGQIPLGHRLPGSEEKLWVHLSACNCPLSVKLTGGSRAGPGLCIGPSPRGLSSGGTLGPTLPPGGEDESDRLEISPVLWTGL